MGAVLKLVGFTLVLAGCGAGKSDEEKAKEACLSSCDSYATYMVGCGIGLGSPSGVFCEEQCAGIEAAFDVGCGDEVQVVLDCRGDLNWAATECDVDAIDALQQTACSDSEAAFAECLVSVGNAGDSTTPNSPSDSPTDSPTDVDDTGDADADADAGPDDVDYPPSVSITAPSNGDVFMIGEVIVFQAVVSDAEDVPSELQLVWVSYPDGEMTGDSTADSSGSASLATSGLSEGTHEVTLTVEDTAGNVGDDSVTIRIEAP
jgi:hypothetical protein